MGTANTLSRAATPAAVLQEVLQRQHCSLEAFKLYAMQHHRLTLPPAISAMLCCTWRWQLHATLQLTPGRMHNWVACNLDACRQGAVPRLC